MNELPHDAQDYLNELRGRPGAAAPATLGEIWNAEWTRTGLDTIGGIGKPFQDAYQELSDAVEAAHGSDLGSLTARYGVNMGAAVTPDLRVAALNALADQLPDDKQKELLPLRDVRKRAADKAQAIEREASDVEGRTYGLTGTGTAFLAGVVRQTLDPVNLAAMAATAPIGGTFEGPILKVIGRQALAGGIAQAAVEPYIQPARAELGLQAGFKEGALDVGQAALGAGGIAGLFRGGAAVLRRFNRSPATVDQSVSVMGRDAAAAPEFATAESAPAAAPGSSAIERLLHATTPDDLDAAAAHVEARRAVDMERPPGPDLASHAAAVEDAGRAIETGRPSELVDVPAAAAPADAAREPTLSELPLGDKKPPVPEAAKPPVEGEAAPPKPLGDATLAADAARVMAEAPDLDVMLPGRDGGEVKLKAADALKAVDEDAAAVREMLDCIGSAAA